jgi:hypothetical protein
MSSKDILPPTISVCDVAEEVIQDVRK